MSTGNIQIVVKQLTVEKLQLYLLSQGWQVVNHGPPKTRGFQGAPIESGDVPRIWVFESESHPKFRSRLQNALFSLSVVEKREPMEIAKDISAVHTASPSTLSAIPSVEPVPSHTPPVANSHAARLRNIRPGPLRIILPSDQRELTLAPQEAITFEFSKTSRDWELQIAEDSLCVHGILATKVACFDLPGREFVVGDINKLTEFIRFQLRNTGAISGTLVEGLLSEMMSTMARAMFEMPASSINGMDVDGILRQTAILSTAFARRLPHQPEAHTFLWRLAVWLLAIVNLQLPRDHLAARFFEVAQSDHEAAPHLCLDWLKQYAVPRV